MNNLILAAIFGFIGGITRALVGILKYKQIKKSKFKIFELTFTILASGIIGLFCGLLISSDFTFSLLAGYAGTDLIEGIYKIRKAQKIII